MVVPDVVVKVKTDEKAVDIDTALTLTQHRWFHWRLLLIGGFAFVATGFEFTLHAYVLPFAECDLGITAADMGVINAVFLSGSLVSSLFWGIAADTIGRKNILVVAAIMEGICTIIASWSTNYIMFAAIRCICGFLCGSGATILLSFIGEFCCDKNRPRNICLMGFAWTLSWMLLPGLAAVVINQPWVFHTSFLEYRSWRFFVALVGVPNIISGLLIGFFLVETPKFYLSKGKHREALEVLQLMYTKNTGYPGSSYPATRLLTGNPEVDNYPAPDDCVKQENSFGNLCVSMFSQMKLVLCPPLLWNTLLSASVYVCGMFGYYGLGLWFPEIFNRFDNHYEKFPNESVTICELIKMKNLVNTTNILNEMEDCASRTINLELFQNTFYIGATCFCGNLLATFLSAKMPARILTAIFLEVAGACALSIYFLQNPALNVAISALFLGSTNAALSVHNTCAINLFPTAVRGMGVCVSFLLGRLSAVMASLVFGLLIDSYCAVPIFLVATLIIMGGGFSMLLPKSSQKALD